MNLIRLMLPFIVLASITIAAAITIDGNEGTDIDSSFVITRSLAPDRHSRRHHHSPPCRTHHVNFNHDDHNRIRNRNRNQNYNNHRHISRHPHGHSSSFYHRHGHSSSFNHRHGHSSSYYHRPRTPIWYTTAAPRLTTLGTTPGPSEKRDRLTLETTTQSQPTTTTSTTTSATMVESPSTSGYFDDKGNFFDIDIRIDDEY